MKKTEKIIGIFAIVSMIGRLLYEYPYAPEFIIFSCLFLFVLYFLFSFLLLNNIRLRNIFKKASYANTSATRIVGAIGAGITLSIIVTGVLFKFFNWPFRNQNLIIGLVLLLCVTVVPMIKFIATNALFYRNLLIRFFIIGGIGLIFLLVTSEELIEIKYRNYPEYVEAEKALLKDPYNETLIQKAIEERKRMREVKE